MKGWRGGLARAGPGVGVAVLVGCAAAQAPTREDAPPAPATAPRNGHVITIPAAAVRPFPGAPGALAAVANPPLASPRPLPPCTYADVLAEKAGYADWARTLVDTTYTLPRSYVPPDLVPVSRAGTAGSGYVRAIVVDDLRALARAARRAGTPLAVRSAYRSYRRQASVFAGWVAASGRSEALQFSARPGHSEHQLGTAVDLQVAGGAAPWLANFGATRQGRWLSRNAWRFGFVVSYPPDSEAVVCYGAEAWHVRYVGRKIAREVYRSGLTLREWLWLHAD